MQQRSRPVLPDVDLPVRERDLIDLQGLDTGGLTSVGSSTVALAAFFCTKAMPFLALAFVSYASLTASDIVASPRANRLASQAIFSTLTLARITLRIGLERNCHHCIKRQLAEIIVWNSPRFAGVLLELVTDGAQQVAPVGHVAIGLHPDGRLSVDDAHNALAIAAGHCFVIFLRDGFPVNILNPVKAVPEVCTIYCATANPVDILVAVTPRGRGITGREFDEFRIIAGAANQPWPGGLAEGQPEP